MNTVRTWQTESTSLNETLRLAEAVGRKLRGGEVIELVSDLGGGKTAFVRGVAHGMGSQDEVSSPSFTLTNEYQAGELSLYHFDFYRLHEPGIMRDELAELLSDPKAVVAVEWSQIAEKLLPAARLTIRVSVTGEHRRLLTFKYPKELSYLFPSNT